MDRARIARQIEEGIRTQQLASCGTRVRSNAVVQVHDAIRERTRGNQFERNIPMARSDQRNPFADHYGNNVDREFIDRACVQERRDDSSTTLPGRKGSIAAMVG